MHLLGDSLASIAVEKGGIIKPGVPVVSAPQPPEALEVLIGIAAKQRSPFTLVGRDWLFNPGRRVPNGQMFTAGPAEQVPDSYCTGLTGEYQALNATVALAALAHAYDAGVNVTQDGIRQGFRHVDWPGRLEVVNREPLLVLDAAHNGASARLLSAELESMFPSMHPTVLVFGASADKDVAGMFDALLPNVDVLIASQAVHPRALATEDIEAVAHKVGYKGTVEQIVPVEDALRRAEELAGSEGMICVTGSLFIVGEVRTLYGLPAGHVVLAAAQNDCG
jgi:dihydrofolate synthase/folylpolyglutamate synthase